MNKSHRGQEIPGHEKDKNVNNENCEEIFDDSSNKLGMCMQRMQQAKILKTKKFAARLSKTEEKAIRKMITFRLQQMGL